MGGLAVLPESPVWLRWVGRAQEAQAAEQQLLGARWQQEGEASSAAQPGRGDAEEPLLNGASSPQSVLHACLLLRPQGSGDCALSAEPVTCGTNAFMSCSLPTEETRRYSPGPVLFSSALAGWWWPDHGLPGSFGDSSRKQKKTGLHPAWVRCPLLHAAVRAYACLVQGEDAPKEGGGWSALLRRRYRRIMVLAGGLLLLQQFSGINTVIYYSSEVKPACRCLP